MMDRSRTGRRSEMKWIKRIGISILSMLVALSTWSVPLTALAEELPVAKIGNGFVDVYIDPASGRFVIQTDQGNPRRENDSEEELLFGGEHPKTSFSTFRIDDKDYIFGNSYGFLGMDSSFVSPASTVGSVNQAKWQLDGVEITQMITLINDSTNPNAGNVKITYLVENKSEKTRKIGSRILLDTKLGPEDASPITLEGENNFVQTEKELSGDLPQYWRASDDTLAPEIMSYGFLSGWNNLVPDRMIVGHWEGMSATKWEYEADSELNFTTDRNEYGSADSAVALYWNALALAPGESRVYETYYGLGDLQSDRADAAYDTLLTGPQELTVNAEKDGYNEQSFQIHLQIDNSLSDAVRLEDVVVELGLPTQLQLAEGVETTKTFSTIEVNDTETVTWEVKAKPQANFEVPRYMVRVRAEGMEETVKANYIILPATNGNLPEVQVLEMLPNMKYVGDETHELSVVGKNLALLTGDPDMKVTFVRETDGHTYTIPSTDTMVSGNVMTIKLDGLWASSPSKQPEPGLYTLHIDGDTHGTFKKQMKYTTDAAYESLKYGILAILSDGTTHEIKPFESEEALAENTQEKLLVIRGSVREFADTASTWYEVEKGATINSVVRFEENSTVAEWLGLNQKITVKKNDLGDVLLNGTGALSIPSFPFAIGEFSISLEDGIDYTLDTTAESGRVEIVWPFMSWQESEQNLNSMPVKIESAKLGKIGSNNTVSFGGKLTINLGGQQKSVGAEAPPTAAGDEAGINVALEEARFGVTENGRFGLQGINANGEVAVPKDFIPGMNFGAEAAMEFNTFIHQYGMSVAVEFEVIEINGNLVLRLTDENIPVIDKLEFAIGGDELGLPLVPPTVVGEIKKAGGGFDNLYDTIMGNYEVLPPLKLILIGSMELAEVAEANDMRLEMSLQGTSFTGSLDILEVPILKSVYGNIRVKDSTDIGVDVNIGAKLLVLDVIKGNAELAFSYDEARDGIFGPVYLAGRGNIAIVIPGSVPAIGGAEITSVSAELSTEQLMAQMKVLEIPVGVSYAWGGDVRFITSNQETAPTSLMNQAAFDSASGDYHGQFLASHHVNAPKSLKNQAIFDPETGDYQGQINFGTNIRKITSGSPKRAVASLNNEYMVERFAADQSYDLNIAEVDDHMFLELPLNSSNVPDVSVNTPSGPFQLVENENYHIRTVSADESESGEEEHYMVIAVQSPETGIWTITASEPLKDDPAAYSVSALPEIKNVEASVSDNNVTVAWDLANVEAGKEVALYLTKDNSVPGPDSTETMESTDVHVLGPNGINADAKTASFTIPDTLASGDYYIKAVLVDGNTNLHSAYSSKTITITNTHEPAKPVSVQSASIGSGILKVAWDYDSTKAHDGFAIQTLDANGNALPGVGAVIIDDPAQLTANIGGVYRDTATGEEFGILPGNSYKAAVTAFHTVNGKKVYGQSAMSGLIYIPEPNPATVTLALPAEQAKAVKDEAEKNVYMTTLDSVELQVDANQAITADLYVDGEFISTHTGTSISKVLSFEEGEHFVEIRAMNENGDITISSIRVRRDSTVPDLKIASPSRSETASGNVEVIGVAEPGSTVTIDGETVALTNDGQFNKTLAMEGYLTRMIEVVAEDQAGNQTTYRSEIVNSNAPTFDHVKIRSAPVTDLREAAIAEVESEGVSVIAGQSKQMILVGVDAVGNEYVLDENNVEWDVFVGDKFGSISTDGTLTAHAEGELYLKASYSIGSSYSYEDVIVVHIEPASLDPEDPGDPEEPIPDDVDQDDDNDDRDNNDRDTSNTSDKEIENILRESIEADKNTEYLGFIKLSEDEDISIQMDDTIALSLFKQEGTDGIGVGYGVVNNPNQFLSDSLELYSNIYEIELNEPIVFAKQPILTFKPPLNEAIDRNKLKIYWYNEEKGNWEYIGGMYDADRNTISVKLPHFSKYALLYDPDRPIFADLTGRWSEDAVYRLHSIGAIDGYETADGWLFRPEAHITRQEFLKILIGTLEDHLSQAALPDTYQYHDVDQVGHWAVPYVSTAIKNKWLLGSRKDGKLYLEPGKEITRAEAAVFVYRKLSSALKPNDEKVKPFKDAEEFPQFAIEAINALSSYNIMNGYSDGTYKPDQFISREEASILIQRILDWEYKQNIE